jgi:hypothetical protein
MALVLKTLWMPLCVVMVGYYAGGILLLGNTPGVRLFAPGGRPKTPSSGGGGWRKIWSFAPRALGSHIASAGDCNIALGDVPTESLPLQIR